jgi:excisionase family DNA binding protein
MPVESDSTLFPPKARRLSRKPMPPLAPLDPLQRYTVDETVRYLRTSRPTFYADVKAGRIKTIKHGRRRYVSGAEIARVSA